MLAGSFPCPAPEAVTAAAVAFAALPDGAVLLIDGLALTPLAGLLAAEARRLRFYALIHHPLCDETGLDATTRDRMFACERQALALAEGVIVTSATTARRLADFAVPDERIRVVVPGADRSRLAAGGCHRRRRRHRRPVRMLCVASLTRRKGQDVLLRALARLRRLDWRLALVGPARDRAFSRKLRGLARALRLAPRVRFEGALSAGEVARRYAAADLFVLASRHEGFGIAIVEAAAAGLAIVSTTAGAIPEAAADTGAQLVAVDDPAALARAVRTAIAAGPRRRCGRAGSGGRGWDVVRREFIAALTDLADLGAR